MRVLALSSWWPEPPDNGSRLRIKALLQALAARHELHLLALTQETPAEASRAALEQICASVQGVPQRVWKPRPGEQLLSLLRAEPSSYRATWNPELDRLVRARVAQLKPDLAIAFQAGVAPYVLDIPPAIPCLLEELEVGRFLNDYRLKRGLGRARSWLTWVKQRRYIQLMLRRFAACSTVSDEELELVRSMAQPSLRLAVIPNGADVEGCAHVRREPKPGALIYPGALSFDANLDAMQYFARDILPIVQARHPEAQLKITGRSTPEQRAQIPSATQIVFTGFVPDVRPLIAESWCTVLPLRLGGGTRLKALESMALGTPIVSTAKGVEGIAIVPGKHALIADRPEEFAGQVNRLLESPQLRQSIAAAALAFVSERYDWRAIGARLNGLAEATVRELAARGR